VLDLLEAKGDVPPLQIMDSEPLGALAESWLSSLQSPRHNTSGKQEWKSYTSDSWKCPILVTLEARGGPSSLTVPPSALRTAQGTAVATEALKKQLLG